MRDVRGEKVFEIEIDRASCMGSGNCAFWAPGVFEVGDDGVAVVVDAKKASVESVMRAVEGCPTQSILLRTEGDTVPDGDPAGTAL